MDYMKAYDTWVNSPELTGAEREELRAVAGDQDEIESRFFSQLEFGTAGLRGIMGIGLYRMNRYVVRHTTQAFAEVILEYCKEHDEKGSIAICYDCRNNSWEFAVDAARVMAANAGAVVRYP
jgi:phosphoglucomutase